MSLDRELAIAGSRFELLPKTTMSVHGLSSQWGAFHMLQQLAYRRTSSKKMHAAELALDRVLDGMLDGSVAPDRAHRKFKTVSANRARADRRRGAALKRELPCPRPEPSGFELAALNEDVARARADLDGEGKQWRLLLAAGAGYTMEEIANENGDKVGTIKAKVSRARGRLRVRAA